MSERPDYSPREIDLLRRQCFVESPWFTAEQHPRPVTFVGPSGVDPDVFVVVLGGEKQRHWLMACGNSSFDGQIIGTDTWIREGVRP